MRTKTLMNLMGITFFLTGIVFVAIGFLMLLMMNTLSSVASTLGAFGAGGSIGIIVIVGWIFSIITFAAGAFSIISAIALFVSNEE